MNPLNYSPELLQALGQFRQMGAWSGSVPARKQKFEWLHRRLCGIYRKDITLRFEVPDRISRWSFSGQSEWRVVRDNGSRHEIITLKGRLSVITFLHEWGHALGLRGQTQAQAYAVGLFRLIFPEKFARLQRVYEYCLVRPQR